MAEGIKYTPEQISRLVNDVYGGRITLSSLPEDLYFAIADGFKKKLYGGYGKTLEELAPGSDEWTLLANMRENLYIFSAAKTFHIVKEIQALSEQAIEKNVYEEQAAGIVALYGDTWQETEANTTEAISQSARKWEEIERDKEILPLLRWNAVVDDVTDDECMALEGLTLPVDDPFWDSSNPPLHWNCRCVLEQVGGEAEESTKEQREKADELIDEHASELFNFNAWKEEIVFPPNHPYFDVEKQYQELAQENFNLPIPEND